MKTHTIKNLTIIDIDVVASQVFKDTISFCHSNSISSITDIKKIYLHYYLSELLDLYTNRTTINVLLYHDINVITWEDFEKLNEPVVNLLRNKLKFPMIEGNMSISNYISLISSDSPEYDDAVNNNFNFIDSLGFFKSYIKRSGLIALERQYSDLKQISTLIFK